MFKLKWLVILVLFLFLVPPSFADDNAKIIGVWKLVSFDSEWQATGERESDMGKNPAGYVIYTREGRMMVIITAEGREAPKTDQDRANLFKSLFAYAATYRIEGDKLFNKVEVSWNPAWVGTELQRFLKFDGDRLHIVSAWMPSTRWPEKGMHRGIMTFERVK
jgi:hypothetical protein